LEIRALKALLTRLDGLGEDLQREKNRREKALASKAPEEALNSVPC